MNTCLKDHKIDVLDKGFVRLIDYMGGDLRVVQAARVSHDADWRTGADEGKDAKLIHHLLKQSPAHTGPFEHVALTVEVKAPLFIFREWHRHRTWSYSELSARYQELIREFYVPTVRDIGVQDKKNKQARNRIAELSVPDRNTRSAWRAGYIARCERTFDAYTRALKDGIPREVARIELPLSTYSRMFGTVNLHNLLRFLMLRDAPGAQWEIQEYARAIMKFAEPIAPVTYAAWQEVRP